MAVKKTVAKKTKTKTLSAKEKHQKKLEALAKLEAMEPEVHKAEEKVAVAEKEETPITPTQPQPEVAHDQPKEEEKDNEQVAVTSAPAEPPVSDEEPVAPSEQHETPEVTEEKKEEVQTFPTLTDSPVKEEQPYTEQVQQLGSLQTVSLQTDEGSGAKKRFILIVLAIILLVFAGLGGAYYYMQTAGAKPEQAKPAVTKIEPTATPTTAPTPELTSVTIDVLNGSGIRGEAARLQEALEADGFTVGTVGNADNSDYTQTVIQAKESVDEAILTKLTETLEKSYGLADTETLEDSETADIIVIIGSEKAAQ